MSSIRLKKEHDGHKPGAVISVPWLRGKELVAGGVAVYANQPEPVKAEPVKAPPVEFGAVKAAEPEKPKAPKAKLPEAK